LGLPPAALARHADQEERRRELARALHAPRPSRARGITDRLEEMAAQIALYRAKAIALHARLMELESAGNDNVADLRRRLIESSVAIEGIARALVSAPTEPRLARGTEAVESPADDWSDQPTLRHAR
jgi:hypothetical protein